LEGINNRLPRVGKAGAYPSEAPSEGNFIDVFSRYKHSSKNRKFYQKSFIIFDQEIMKK
jgi:hypothetical protein